MPNQKTQYFLSLLIGVVILAAALLSINYTKIPHIDKTEDNLLEKNYQAPARTKPSPQKDTDQTQPNTTRTTSNTVDNTFLSSLRNFIIFAIRVTIKICVVPILICLLICFVVPPVLPLIIVWSAVMFYWFFIPYIIILFFIWLLMYHS